jgi:septal ring factor EnvC (AmiA/AmiB activator)
MMSKQPLDGKKSAWDAPNINQNLRGRMLVNALARVAAKLEGLRHTINEQDKELLQRATRVHDQHQDLAAKLRQELQNPLNQGDENTTLEDAYGQHLQDRAAADDLLSQLHHNVTNFHSRTEPSQRREPQLTVPVGIAQDDNAVESEDTTGDSQSGNQ